MAGLEVVLTDGEGTVLAEAGLAARAGAKAAVTVDMTNALADPTYTAKDNGYAGNGISVAHVVALDDAGDPLASQALAVSVDASKHFITVQLATSGAGAVTTTCALLKAAVNAHAVASTLVVCEDEGAGTGVVEAKAEAFLVGGVDELTLATGEKFRVVALDATNAQIEAYTDADRDYLKSTDVLSVAIADLVTACTAPA